MWDRICIEWWWWVLYSDLTHKKSILEAPFCIKIYSIFFSTGNNPCFKSTPFSLALNINSDYEMILQFKGNSRFPYEMCFHSFGWKKFFFVNFSSWKAINPNDLQQSTLTFFPSSFLPSFLYVLGGILFCGWRWGFEAYRLSDTVWYIKELIILWGDFMK